MATFPEKLRAARIQSGLTQAELAKAADCSIRSLYDWENGVKIPRAISLARLADALGVSQTFLMNDDISDPLYDIEADNYIQNGKNAVTRDRLADQLTGVMQILFAGDSIDLNEKTAIYEAITKAYREALAAATDSQNSSPAGPRS